MDGSIDERVDFDRLQAARPSWRLFLAHPALGLEEAEGDAVVAPGASELGVAWLALDIGEQRARERDLVRELLCRAARCLEARFEAGWRRDERETADLARRCGASLSEDGAARGLLTDGAIDVLVATPPELTVVEAAELALIIDGEPLRIGVWMDRWKAPVLQRELLDCVWEQAGRREGSGTTVAPSCRRDVDRAFRAHLVVGWARHGGQLVIGAFCAAALLGWHPLGNGEWGDTAVLAVGGLTTVWGVDWLVNRWYRRTQRDCE
ncbi:MAG TPA: hypothetical protein VKB25_06705 [Conexibacter sp.]|nr:hypothetical protein [Conexibacter sp.]